MEYGIPLETEFRLPNKGKYGIPSFEILQYLGEFLDLIQSQFKNKSVKFRRNAAVRGNSNRHSTSMPSRKMSSYMLVCIY